MAHYFDSNSSPDSYQTMARTLGNLHHGSSSVVVPNATLQLGQCGLPKKVAIDLYRAQLVERLLNCNHVDTIDEAEYAIACEWNQVLDELVYLLHCEPILLLFSNKIARCALQAFEPKLIEGSSIQIHPTIAQQLGIDFSGQTVFEYLSHSRDGRTETLQKLNSAQSFQNQRNGSIDQTIPKESAVGIRYLTLDSPIQTEPCDANFCKPPLIGSITELELAMQAGHVRLHDRITVRLPDGKLLDAAITSKRTIVTTAGRLLFNERLPIGMPFYNQEIRWPTLKQIIQLCLSQSGRNIAIQLVENLSQIGWATFTRSGLSIGMNDLKISTQKERHYAEARKQVEKWNRFKQKVLLDDNELHRQTVDSWCYAHTRTTDDIARQLESASQRNSLLSLARGLGFIDDLVQISGMIRISNSQSSRPLIAANYHEGLSTHDYFRCCMDLTSRNCAIRRRKRLNRSWQLARELNDSLREIYVSMHDCGTLEGFAKTAIYEGIDGIKLIDRVIGRVSTKRIVAPKSGEVLLERNQLITKEVAEILERSNVEQIEVRSPTGCRAPDGICQLCYGVQPHTGALPAIGERVGSQAALAISETTSRLGGQRWYGSNNPWLVESYNGDSEQELARRPGRIRFDETKCAINRIGQIVVVTEHLRMSISDEKGQMVEQIDVPYASILKVKNGEHVQYKQPLAEWSPNVYKLIAEHSGWIRLSNLDVNARRSCEVQESIVVPKVNVSPIPTIEIVDEQGTIRQTRYLYAGTKLLFGDGSHVTAGDLVAAWRRPKRKTDPNLAESPLPKWVATISHLECLLNLTVPTGEAAMAEFDGELSISQAENGVRLKLVDIDGSRCKEFIIPHSKSLFNFYAPNMSKMVSTGDLLSQGGPSWHDTLRVFGPKPFAEKWIQEVLLVHYMNKLKIAEQHLELALGKMTSLCQLTDTGDTNLLPGAVLKRTEFDQVNAAISKNDRPAKAKSIAIGLFSSVDSLISSSEK